MENKAFDFLRNSGIKLLILLMIGMIISFKDFDFRLNISSPNKQKKQEQQPPPIQQNSQTPTNDAIITEKNQKQPLNEQKSNLGPNAQIKEGNVSTALQLLTKLKQADKKTVNSYIKRFSHVSVDEMIKHQVPASITLAQALLNSAAGTTDIAKKGNNHFGINCGEKWNGEKMVYGDAFCYRKYQNAWQSFRDHSLFVTRGKFSSLKSLGIKDYRSWANGLEQANFSFDMDYAEVLIQVIQDYKLDRYDAGVKD